MRNQQLINDRLPANRCDIGDLRAVAADHEQVLSLLGIEGETRAQVLHAWLHCSDEATFLATISALPSLSNLNRAKLVAARRVELFGDRTSEFLPEMPVCLDAEQTIISAIAMRPETVRPLIADVIPSDFGNAYCREMFEFLMHGRSLDELQREMSDDLTLQQDILSKIANGADDAAVVKAVKVVTDKANLRRLVIASCQVIALAQSQFGTFDDCAEILKEQIQLIYAHCVAPWHSHLTDAMLTAATVKAVSGSCDA